MGRESSDEPADGNSVVDNLAYACVMPPSAAKSMPVM